MDDQRREINALQGQTLEFPSAGRNSRATAPRKLVVGNRIGEGSASCVFAGSMLSTSGETDTSDGTGGKVAVKVLRPELLGTPVQERFLREAELLCRMSHPNLVRGIGLGTTLSASSGCAQRVVNRPGMDSRGAWPGTEELSAGGAAELPFMVMELVEGPSLSDLMRSGQQIETRDALGIAMGVVSALGYLHLDGRVVAHRDIKPSNILLAADGTPKLMDLGVAKVQMVAERGLETRLAGTIRYMAPEQIADSTRADIRSDIYSLGIVLYELLGGKLPEDERELVSQRMSGWVPELGKQDLGNGSQATGKGPSPNARPAHSLERSGNAGIGAIDRILGRMCAYEPYDRYQTPQDLVPDLREMLRSDEAGKAQARDSTKGLGRLPAIERAAMKRRETSPAKESDGHAARREPATARRSADRTLGPESTVSILTKSTECLARDSAQATARSNLQVGRKSEALAGNHRGAQTLAALAATAAIALAIAAASNLGNGNAAPETPPTGTEIVIQRMESD